MGPCPPTRDVVTCFAAFSVVLCRGTSTFDGLAIAWAVAEDLVLKNDKGVKTLFATHYHELTDLARTQPRVRNYSIAVREWNDTIIFLHKLVEGSTNRSYGIQVAALAGVHCTE